MKCKSIGPRPPLAKCPSPSFDKAGHVKGGVDACNLLYVELRSARRDFSAAFASEVAMGAGSMSPRHRRISRMALGADASCTDAIERREALRLRRAIDGNSRTVDTFARRMVEANDIHGPVHESAVRIMLIKRILAIRLMALDLEGSLPEGFDRPSKRSTLDALRHLDQIPADTLKRLGRALGNIMAFTHDKRLKRAAMRAFSLLPEDHGGRALS